MRLLIFGLGYASEAIARRRLAAGGTVVATVRTAVKAERLSNEGILTRLFSPEHHDHAIFGDIAGCEAVLVSIPPSETGDEVLRIFGDALAAAPKLRWLGYLSTVGVYGDRNGDWVDETTPPAPIEPRSKVRWQVEQDWLAFGERDHLPVQIFRLAGIYGPGRNALAQLAAGTARRIVRPGQVFNRVHVDDIAQVVCASMAHPRAGAIYNVSDDEPAPPQDVVTFAAGLCGVPPPLEVAFEDAKLSPMGRSFYDECKRVKSTLLHSELGVKLEYPTYRHGLRALRAAGEGP